MWVCLRMRRRKRMVEVRIDDYWIIDKARMRFQT